MRKALALTGLLAVGSAHADTINTGSFYVNHHAKPGEPSCIVHTPVIVEPQSPAHEYQFNIPGIGRYTSGPGARMSPDDIEQVYNDAAKYALRMINVQADQTGYGFASMQLLDAGTGEVLVEGLEVHTNTNLKATACERGVSVLEMQGKTSDNHLLKKFGK